MSQIENLHEHLARLNEIGIALSGERNLKTLLSKILQEARAFTGAEGGSLYILERNALRFAVMQNERLSGRDGRPGGSELFEDEWLALSKDSMAGYVGLTGEVINLEDVYRIPEERPYRFNPEFDRKNDYRSQSMLLVPMKEQDGRIGGVLQLINARAAEGGVIAFHPRFESLVMSLASQAAVAIRNVRLTEELKKAYFDTILRLSMAVEYKDEDTANHIRRIAEYSVLVARRMGFDAEWVEMLEYAAPMHDIGKIGIPDAVLQKPGKLTSEEFEEMKQHTLIGARLLGGSEVPVLQMSAAIALTHHERRDGSGYPRGLRKDQIPTEGQIVALADVFDALSSPRCYKRAYAIEQCLEIIETERHKFHPDVVSIFLDRMDDVLRIRERYSLAPTELPAGGTAPRGA
ncbi:MAG TPA: HD domain-containing phosphohydrolase [Phycisphaerae bacterium]|nr:HD domain-containing phosphohydrolase [Phycisphaerae bacterium]